jgi:hypothetical protein
MGKIRTAPGCTCELIELSRCRPNVRSGSRASPSAIDGRASTSAVRRQRPNSRGTAICRDGTEAVGRLRESRVEVQSPGYHLVEGEQATTNRVRLHSAPRPGLTNACGRAIAIAVPATVKTSAMTRSVRDLRHMKSMSIVPGGLMCGALGERLPGRQIPYALGQPSPPSCSGFTISQIGGIMGHVRPHSNAGASITGSAVGPPNLDGSS